MPFVSDVLIAGHRINGTLLSVLLAVLLAWVAAYLVYKVFWHADFGLPVRRRLLCRGLRVQRDQVAFVPIWWSDLQVQRAVRGHWKSSLRSRVAAGPQRQDEAAPRS